MIKFPPRQRYGILSFGRYKEWWRTLGYCWNFTETNNEGICFRTFGIRPYGKRWFWFVIDDSDTAEKK